MAMPYNFDSVPSRRNPAILNKWSWYPEGILPMWLADTDFPTAPQIQDALQKQVEHGVLGYELPSKALYEIIAARLKKLYGWSIEPEWITYTAGVNNGYNIAVRVLCSPKKGYVIQTPVYNPFHEIQGATGFRQQEARLEEKVVGNRIRYEVDFEAFEKAVKKSGMFLLCHPHNPVGKIFSRAELAQMAEICIANGVTIVSDEIHGELLLGGAAFTPLAKISRDVEPHTITLISASKAFNMPGLACAFALISDAGLRKKFRKVANSMSFEVSTPGLTAARIAYLGKADAWLKALRRYLTANRDFVLKYVDENLPGVRVTKPDATYLMWMDCTELKLKPTPYEFFLKGAKVALSDGRSFGNGSGQFVRLNFGTTRGILTDGLERVRKSLK
jgi:cystathionine beta-lyase